ncbi:hypothetical protein SPX_26220 [Sporomusa paucivorans]
MFFIVSTCFAKKRLPWIVKWTYEMVPQTVWKLRMLTALGVYPKGAMMIACLNFKMSA